MNYFFPDFKISQSHGKGVILRGKIIYSLYHPAAALRSTQVLKDLETDFKKLPDLLKKLENVEVEEVALKKPAQSSLF